MATPATPAVPPPSIQTHQFLSTVLSQRGPSSLPYSEDVKWLIRQHLLSLSDAVPSLRPKTAAFNHNDGRTVNLLQADGTVPMIFMEVTYYIPVVIWLMESYPRYPPLVFVNPTSDMIVKHQHRYVNSSSGLVSVPYLHNWVYPSSNLVDLARDLSRCFGLDPPLYSSRPPSSVSYVNNPNPSFSSANSMISSDYVSGARPASHVNNPSPSFSSVNSMISSDSMNGVRPAIPPRSYPASPYGSNSGSGRMQMPPRVGPTEDPTEVFKRNAVNKLVENLHGDVVGLKKGRESEMESLFGTQAVLRQREELLGKGLREMQGEMGGLEQQLQMVLMNTDVLESWVRENEGKKVNVDGDSAFEPVDALSKQLLDCTASDLAIEDVVYELDKAVQEGSIPFDQYLRNVRSLSREQFFHRATSSKIRAVQMQAQVAGMAARAPQYAV